MGEVLTVFISATTADLGAVRAAAKHALVTLGYLPIEQEHFGPAPETLLAGDRRRLAECDAVLHIVGECYGYEPPSDPAQPRFSLTQWEYHIARELKKPLFLFVCADDFPYNLHDPESEAKRALQRAHREAILRGPHHYHVAHTIGEFELSIREIPFALQGLRQRRSWLWRLLVLLIEGWQRLVDQVKERPSASSLSDPPQLRQFPSCFISYSTANEQFVRRLHEKLRGRDIPVWYAPEDLRGGSKIVEQVDEAIRIHDKLLIVLSEESLRSEWVMDELRKAFKAQHKSGKRKLFPVRICDYDTLLRWECRDSSSGKDLAEEVRQYFIPDFSNWKSHDQFEACFARLVRDLEADSVR
ncbi:MAG TPA: TIR domain-containing protein [Chthoniobacteraceae bacterium]|jgi:hypothetical protein|nr:TIR domain-containing protein [Chthoniobacteraceae bacterium]